MKSNCSKTEKITRAKKLALVIFTLSSNYLVVAEAVGFEPTSPKRTTAFRVRPVMTTSIRFHMITV